MARCLPPNYYFNRLAGRSVLVVEQGLTQANGIYTPTTFVHFLRAYLLLTA